ncbi:hypothetical protein DERP_006573 [Dermatophagoides pteronyssinus]|uniref:Uncharacterized protein n=1 Tax=Dermatophagoides pteronyssinus TaxID=6956 RepID=A0ABQ8IQK6_DERPT|nr:hypothetical protein DERP_006573 [Dermatophagoides pteronyssinus]
MSNLVSQPTTESMDNDDQDDDDDIWIIESLFFPRKKSIENVWSISSYEGTRRSPGWQYDLPYHALMSSTLEAVRFVSSKTPLTFLSDYQISSD